eukprot:565673-Amphidinium_carterae.1
MPFTQFPLTASTSHDSSRTIEQTIWVQAYLCWKVQLSLHMWHDYIVDSGCSGWLKGSTWHRRGATLWHESAARSVSHACVLFLVQMITRSSELWPFGRSCCAWAHLNGDGHLFRASRTPRLEPLAYHIKMCLISIRGDRADC